MNGNANKREDNQCADGDSSSAGQKSRNPRYRTKLCRNFPLGTCRYGDSCSYLHVAHTPSPTAPMLSPLHTVARSLFYPTLSLPASSRPPVSAPDARPGTSPGPAQLAQPRNRTHDGRSRAPRRDQPHRSIRGLPPARTPAEEYGADDCPESENDAVRKWRRRREESVSSERYADADAARQHPPAPPATPVSVLGRAGARASSPWKDGAATGGGVGRYRRQTVNREETAQLLINPSTMARLAEATRTVKHRNQFFKTKPCRFYAEPSGCVKGDRCNFIHVHPDEGRRPSGLVAAAEPYSESEPELSGAESSMQGDPLSPLSPSTAATSEHASEHQEPKKNFYPVTWRVVGGGVMMSGKREVCENFMAGHCSEGGECRYAHPEINESEYVVTYPEPPPMYSPISPVIYAYPVVYPTISPPQPFALPAMPGPGHIPPPPAAAIPQIQTAQNVQTYNIWSGLPYSPIDQPSGLPYPAYSPHRVVDGTTLVESSPQSYMYPEGGLYAETLFAARSTIRPVSTPPRPLHGYEDGVTRLFAAEMP